MNTPLTYAERYRTAVPPRPMQDVISQWLAAAATELEIADSLVRAGYELASQAHTEAATECVKEATALFGAIEDSKVKRTIAAYAKYCLDAEKRRTTSDMILAD